MGENLAPRRGAGCADAECAGGTFGRGADPRAGDSVVRPILGGAVPTIQMRTVVRWSSCVARGVRRAWDESEAAQEVLVEINTPWRRDGELRWRHGAHGWELDGNRLPGS